MTPRARILALAGVLAVVVAACGGSSGDHAEDEGPVVCEPGFTTPEGFRQTESFEDPYGDHVGIRLGFVDGQGRELHYFAGIPGEFGEGLPVVDRVAAAEGIEGPLQGSDTTWVLSWRAPGPCGVRAVLGNGFTRTGFLDTLEDAGIVPRG
jgi:hypothetical protein